MQFIMGQVYDNLYGKEQAEQEDSNMKPKPSIIIGDKSNENTNNNNDFLSNC
jgi:hypothetical protein